MPVKGLPFNVYHEAIVYDRGDGSRPTVIQARPSIEYNGSAAQEAWLKDELPRFLEEPAAGVVKSPFGTILAKETRFDPNWNGLGIVSRLAFRGEDLSAQWSDIQRTMHDVNWLGLAYLPVRQNSNSFANSALRNAGISPPVPVGATVPNGFMTRLWTPAANNPLRVLQDRTISLLREFQEFQSLKSLPSDTQVTDAMLSPERAFSSGRPAMFDDRFANWVDTGGAVAPLAPHHAVPPAEDNRPRGIFSGKPMPVYPVPPPIFGFTEAGELNDENWLTLLLAPRRMQ